MKLFGKFPPGMYFWNLI